ncbi:hypothetical protein [Lunatimonas lonarensis]|uniref:hypothetical protein n=1 Tax=Lunatimonas lonarensis TaxID=1232681 RepID=UPI0012DC72AF|nr:hypothetical protein [Lunatimonas lonarensis]
MLDLLGCQKWRHSYEEEKHQLRYQSEYGDLFFRLPIHLNFEERTSKGSFVTLNYLIVIIESGLAALGYFEDSDTIHHKVFRAYMVRKKQGKSQLKYLKTKGKSRAGSRIRLAESLQFFEDINQQLTEYQNTYRIDKIAVSLSTTLVPFFYGAKTRPPFEKTDPRLFHIPRHIASCTYENLEKTRTFLRTGELKFPLEASPVVQKLLQQLTAFQPDAETEDW